MRGLAVAAYYAILCHFRPHRFQPSTASIRNIASLTKRLQIAACACMPAVSKLLTAQTRKHHLSFLLLATQPVTASIVAIVPIISIIICLFRSDRFSRPRRLSLSTNFMWFKNNLLEATADALRTLRRRFLLMIVLAATGTFPDNSTFITFIEKLTSRTFVFTMPAAGAHT